MNRFRVTVTAALALSAAVAWDTHRARHSGSVEDDPARPNVLLIGDSIRIGYAPPTRTLLAGEADVFWPDVNCHATVDGLAGLEGWLGDRAWDVVHFNFGLHDLKHLDAQGQFAAPPVGRPVVGVDDYAANLEQLVDRLAATGATLVWATTTPVPEGALGRVRGDEVRYNAAALEVMVRHGVRVDDLHAFVAPRAGELQKPADVHFTDTGSRALAREVAASVRAALADRAAARGPSPGALGPW